jgi:glyoxylase I family protein
MGIERFSHVAVRVTDMARSQRFYTDVLGFDAVTELRVEQAPSFRAAGIEDAVMHAVFLRRDGVVVELQDVRHADGSPVSVELSPLGLRHMGLRVHGVDPILDEVVAAGGSVLHESRHRDDEWRSDVVFVLDPDGTRIELVDFPGDPGTPPGESIARDRSHEEPWIVHPDDLEWHEVRSLGRGDQRVSVWNKFADLAPDRTVVYTRYDGDMVLARHWHHSTQIVFVVEGELSVNGRRCPKGTIIVFEPGVGFGPLVAGPEGVLILEIFAGRADRAGQDRTGYAALLAERGLVELPNPPFTMPPHPRALLGSDGLVPPGSNGGGA